MAETATDTGLFAAIRIRGDVNVKPDLRKTLLLLKLKRRNTCVLVPKESKGMLMVVNDYVAWGEINKENLAKLSKKGSEKIFRLHPPRHGFRGGIKKSFSSGGNLGYMGKAINELLARML